MYKDQGRVPDLQVPFTNKTLNIWLLEITDERNIKGAYSVTYADQSSLTWEDGTLSHIETRDGEAYYQHKNNSITPFSRDMMGRESSLLIEQSISQLIKQQIEEILLYE